MSTVKTRVNQDEVAIFLKKKFDDEVSNIEFISGGELSQAFSFVAKNENLVIRFGTNTNGYEKDKYASEHFGSEKIPIPKIKEIGQFDEKYSYAISEKADGQTLNKLNDEEYAEIFPELFNILTAIHNITIPHTNGFGYWAPDGTVEKPTWKEYILNVNQYVKSSENKPSLFEASFLEKDFWEEVYSKMQSLLSFSPEEKYLVHGDYGSDNVTANKGVITGVLDWASSKYGDFLYDIAWLNFWNPTKNPMAFFEKYYTEIKPTQNFKERVMCCQLRIGLSSLSFYAFSNQKEKYDSAKNKLLSILENK